MFISKYICIQVKSKFDYDTIQTTAAVIDVTGRDIFFRTNDSMLRNPHNTYGSKLSDYKII